MLKILASIAIAGSLIGPAVAQDKTTQQSPPSASQTQKAPNLWGIPEFSPQSDYLSLTGYVKEKVYQKSMTWMPQKRAREVLRQQVAEASHVSTASR